ADVAFEWNQAFLDQECFMVPKTALNPAGAMKLINAALDPVNQANFAKRVGYGPINTKAFDTGILTPAEIAWMPMAPQNLPKQITADPLWYSSAEADAAYLRYSKAIQ
ncbi:MAG: extracellular solute-binding protein, partial [Pseudolabrys sp.]